MKLPVNVLSAPIFLEWRSAPAPALEKGVPLPHRSFGKKGVALFYRSFQKKPNLSKKLQTREFFLTPLIIRDYYTCELTSSNLSHTR